VSVLERVAAAWTQEEARDPAAVAERLAGRGVTLAPEEVTLLGELLGRVPTWPEAVLFGILWSEHCSYKSTRHLLRRLPTQAPQVLVGPGEDAGVVALPAPADEWAMVLAHESHNHPSQVLPVEGAATGIGGIVRDVGCMGAEVVGVLDCLRFGEPRGRGAVGVRDIVRGVVQGIADYGNALGVPNLGGDVYFSRAFDKNCLVNVVAVGLVPRAGILHSAVPGRPGRYVFLLVGKPTDESGFGGAAFASGELGGDQRGAVQLPDPFLKRVLQVANAEVFRRLRERGVAAGFKDLGAGGVACAVSELAAAGGRGARVSLERVHRVERPLPPEVVLCAETQERYCWVLPEEEAEEVRAVYEQEFALGEVYPGAGARVVAEALEERRFVVDWQGESVCDVPVEAITAARRVQRPARRRAPARPLPAGAPRESLKQALLQLLATPDLCSRDYLYRHYDSEVQGRTWLRPGEADACVIRALPDRGLGIALGVGGNPYWCAADPELGARHAVAEAARNVACAGARPWALTDCLNFGHPESPEVMGDLEAVLDGLAAAAEALGHLAAPAHPLPFVSGNVSLYNQTGEVAVPPSPVVVCAGVLRDLTQARPAVLQRPGDFLVLVGEPRDDLSGSAYARARLGDTGSAPPRLDLERESRLQELAVLLAEGREAVAAHDVSDGGLGVAVAEMLLARPAEAGLGAELNLELLEGDPFTALFCERPAILFEVAPARAAALFHLARERGLSAWPIGAVAAHGRLHARFGEGRTTEWTRAELEAASHATLRALWNEEEV
jgi:phosphoribosylformylglycinamidine synthase